MLRGTNKPPETPAPRPAPQSAAQRSWRFLERWPDGQDGPRFDLARGDALVASFSLQDGKWSLVFQDNPEGARDLIIMLQTLSMIADRVRAVEKIVGQRCEISTLNRAGETMVASHIVRHLLEALTTTKDSTESVHWGSREE